MKQTIYMDHAAATPIHPSVQHAMEPYFADQFYNPSANYLAAQAVRSDIEAARGAIAASLGVKKTELIFTAGASEANNLAIHGIMRRFPKAKVLVSAVEHKSVLEPAEQYNVGLIPVDHAGLVRVEELERLITDDTVLVSIQSANNEIGTVQAVADYSEVIAKVRLQRQKDGISLPIYLHSDAAQALNYLTVQPHRSGVDLLSLNGGKIYGPKQTGLLFVRSGVILEPLIYGGGQERGLRSGTENVPGIIGLSVAVVEAVVGRAEEVRRMKLLQQQFKSELKKDCSSIVLTVPKSHTLPNIVHISVPNYDNERLMMELDERGIQCAVGSACSASSDEPSHVLTAIGMTDQEAQSSLRFSMGRSTSSADVSAVVTALKAILHD